jgi:hypothetical protein
MDKSEFCTFIEMFHSKKANIAAERTDTDKSFFGGSRYDKYHG